MNEESKKNETELVMILDQSGSMRGLEESTVSGYNEMLEKQKKVEGDCLLSTILFNTERRKVVSHEDLKEASPMEEKDFVPSGCTALLDAVGLTIEEVEANQAEAQRTPKTIFAIITDGLENASRLYDYPRLKRLIERKKRDGWEFLFLGANMDAESEAGKLGIDEEDAVSYQNDEVGVTKNFMCLSACLKQRRTFPSSSKRRDSEWKKDIEDYFESKQGK